MATRKWGSETPVATTDAGNQLGASVTALTDGGWVVAWTDTSGATDRVRYQEYSASGARVGVEGTVPVSTLYDARDASVTALAGGGFAIGYEVAFSATDQDVYVSRYDGAGVYLGSDGIEADVAIGSDPSLASDGTGYAVTYKAGLQAEVSTWTATGTQTSLLTLAGSSTKYDPDVAEAANGDTVTVWHDDNDMLYVEVISSGGMFVNSIALGNIFFPTVDVLANGNLLVTWTDFSTSQSVIEARLCDALGAPIGAAFRVNSTGLGGQYVSDVAGLSSGGFAIVWADSATATIRGQVFSASSSAQGAEFVVTSSPAWVTADPNALSVTELTDGRLVVTWTGFDADGSLGVMSQVIDPRDGVVNGTVTGETLYGNAAVGDEVNGLGGGDTLWGMKGDDALYGGDGDDNLQGGAGDDLLYGDRGRDVLVGGGGADDIEGGADLDAVTYAASAGAVQVTLDGGPATGGDAQGDTLSGVETLTGSALGDTLRGAATANVLTGLAGDDTLTGGAGQDTLTGGAGLDDFVFAATSESSPSATRDRIADFEVGLDDIVLTAIDANTGVGGNQAFVLDAGGAFAAGEIHQVVSGGNLILQFNTDADAAVEMSITVFGVAAPLAASDFAL